MSQLPFGVQQLAAALVMVTHTCRKRQQAAALQRIFLILKNERQFTGDWRLRIIRIFLTF
jgi:hypothetical protein